jgi:Flp pilus assembly protein TadD
MSRRPAAFSTSVLLAASAAYAADCGPTPHDCAVSQVQRQDFPSAVSTLDKIVSASPRDLKALNLLGIALTGAGQIDKANARVRQALRNRRYWASALRCRSSGRI